ncbi:hypothetical protein ANCDUO_07572 [Ancylostoma duodenale]|uniref:Uncharacterized protein n=1 Tax=Ancylostoma duodenale TaxID=51022 RepID=A0A0C2DI54_9BILA|nr:hypothetical protein ANCDUO_07572 [Ancylostoma duodenale]
MKYEETRVDPKEATIRERIKTLEGELANVQKCFQELARKRSCKQRDYEAGVHRSEERITCFYCEGRVHHSAKLPEPSMQTELGKLQCELANDDVFKRLWHDRKTDNVEG